MASLFAAFEDVERLVARTVTEAASAVVESTSEFPKPAHDGAARHPKLVVPLSTTQAASKAKKASSSWEEFDWQDQQVHWADALQQLQVSNTSSSDAAGAPLSPQQLSQQLQGLYEQLLALPDPLPALRDAAALTAKTQELEACNRSLQAQLHNLQQDQAEVTQLLQDYRAEQAAHASLQAAHKALQEELVSVRGASREVEQLQQQAEEQSSTIRSLQATLTSLRSELESSQSSLFELTTRQEQAAGSASTAEQLAVEEVERLSADLLTLRKEKALLERQLQQALQEQQQQQEGAAAAAAASAAGVKGADAAAAGGEGLEQQQQRGLHHSAAAEGQLAAAQAALAAAEEAGRDQQHEIALLSTKLAAAEGRLERANAELQRRPAAAAVAAMAEQLAALSALTGKQLESEGWGAEAAAAAATALTTNPLEQLHPLLQERCTKLERSLQAAKAEAAAAAAAASDAAAEGQALREQLLQAQQLVRTLEADLLALSSSGTTGHSTNSGSASAGGAGALLVNRHSSGLEGLVASGDGGVGPAGDGSTAGTGAPGAEATTTGAAAAGGGGAGDAVLAAVTAQRDRFRARIAELEGAQARLAGEAQAAAARAEAVTKDNVALVEKIRFLERYKQGQAGLGGAAPDRQGSVTVIRVDGAGVIHEMGAPGSGLTPGQADSKAGRYSCGPITVGGKGGASRAAAGGVGGGSRRRQRQAGCFGMLAGEDGGSEGVMGPEARYMKEYEARLNPFAEFQASESEARLRGMRLHDKALLAGSRLIAGSKLARAAVALYVLLLHGVIMALMYFSATPHTTLYATSDSSSSIPSAVARLGNSTAEAAAAAAAGVAGLQEAAAGGRAAAGAGARLLLRAFALPHL